MATVFSAMGTVNSWKSIAANAKKKMAPRGHHFDKVLRVAYSPSTLFT